MRRILIGVDGSEASRQAVAYTLAVWNKEHLVLKLVNVIQPDSSPVQEAAQLNHLQEMTLMISPEQRSRMKLETALIKGDPANQLLETAHSWKPDICVIGVKGMGNCPEGMGGTARALTEKTGHPLLIVPLRTVTAKPEKIVMLDSRTVPQLDVLDRLLYFAKQNHARVSYLRENTHPDLGEASHRDFLKRLYQDEILSGRFTVKAWEAPDLLCGISGYQQSEKPNMLVFPPGHRDFLPSLFRPSSCRTPDLMEKIPVWMFPGQNHHPLTTSGPELFRPNSDT